MVFLVASSIRGDKTIMKTQDEWQKLLQKLQKNKNPLYDLYKDGQLEISTELTFYFSEEETKNKAKAKWPKLQAKFPAHWKNKKINFEVGKLTISSSSQKFRLPLQALNHGLFPDTNDSNKLDLKQVLKQAADEDKNWESLYKQLNQNTQRLADDTLTVNFNWRLRVGGIRGFEEAILPVFHPVYGVPYIPSSSLKGAVRAWAKKNNKSKPEVDRLLGNMDDGIGLVQFLDAFPTKPCLSVDLANPQWHWENQQLFFKPEPHFSLSMKQPELLIGLVRTNRGRATSNNLDDVGTVKEWLEETLSAGIGSRVSSGYGRTRSTASLSTPSSYQFELWTQGMSGAFKSEFRPTALRGMLRYWFRAIAFSLYSPSDCKSLEADLFGTIEPEAKEGKIRIGVDWEETPGNPYNPYIYKGTITLEAQAEKYLALSEKLLQLASHLGGVGKGSRRPLHWNDPPKLRGCYWEIKNKILPCDREAWQTFKQEVIDAFLAIKSQGTPGNGDPGLPGKRKQDVLNKNAKIYLVPCRNLRHPKNVNNWKIEGKKINVRGYALDLLYEERFKGVNQQGKGNPYVGGKISKKGESNNSTPSYVLIQSNFPEGNTPYQAVTIFGSNQKNLGSNQKNRADFSREVQGLGAIKIDW